jgi:hypothetical protein
MQETPMRRSTSVFAALAAVLAVYSAFAGEKTVTLNVDKRSSTSSSYYGS